VLFDSTERNGKRRVDTYDPDDGICHFRVIPETPTHADKTRRHILDYSLLEKCIFLEDKESIQY